jgi:arsenate reductase (glutaredoxin)
MAKKIKAWGLKKCSTTQAALKYLADKKVQVEFSDYSVEPLSKEQVSRWAEALGGWEKLINRSGYTWRGLEPSQTESLTPAKAIALAVKHTSLIRRPLIEHEDGTVTAGFPPKVRDLF